MKEANGVEGGKLGGSQLRSGDGSGLKYQNVLVVDDNCGPMLATMVPYSRRLCSEDNINLFMVAGNVPEEDQRNSVEFLELGDHVYTDGQLEVWAFALHKKYGIHQIYCKSEDLMLRVAYLREAFGITQGLQVSQTKLFRDKAAMRTAALAGGVPSPNFKQLQSPTCLLQFWHQHGLPLVVKPIFGSASLGVSILRIPEEVTQFLRSTMLQGVSDDGGRLEYTGGLMAETFLPGEMYHVNGFAKDGELVYVWPFQYISTNLEFTKGKAYGNIMISSADPRYSALLRATRGVLSALSPLPPHLVFHLELFALDGVQGGGKPPTEFALCEIAARRPGGSIFGMLDKHMGGHFSELDFRCQLGLPLRHQPPPSSLAQPQGAPPSQGSGIVADIVISRSVGRLVSVPETCPIQGVEYRAVAKAGTVYKGFDSAVLNTAAHFVAHGAPGQEAELQALLLRAQAWFLDSIVVEPLPVGEEGEDGAPDAKQAKH